MPTTARSTARRSPRTSPTIRSSATATTRPIRRQSRPSTETLIGRFTATGGGGQPVFYTAPLLNPMTGSEDRHPAVPRPAEHHHGRPSGLTGATTLIPDSEVTYFGRTENLPYTGADGPFFDTPGPAQQSGAVYAVDGLNGNIIWKYGTTNTIIDDSNTVDFATTGFGALASAPDTDFTAPATAPRRPHRRRHCQHSRQLDSAPRGRKRHRRIRRLRLVPVRHDIRSDHAGSPHRRRPVLGSERRQRCQHPGDCSY